MYVVNNSERRLSLTKATRRSINMPIHDLSTKFLILSFASFFSFSPQKRLLLTFIFSCRDNECLLKFTPLNFPSQLADFTMSYFRILKYLSHKEIWPGIFFISVHFWELRCSKGLGFFDPFSAGNLIETSTRKVSKLNLEW